MTKFLQENIDMFPKTGSVLDIHPTESTTDFMISRGHDVDIAPEDFDIGADTFSDKKYRIILASKVLSRLDPVKQLHAIVEINRAATQGTRLMIESKYSDYFASILKFMDWCVVKKEKNKCIMKKD